MATPVTPQSLPAVTEQLDQVGVTVVPPAHPENMKLWIGILWFLTCLRSYSTRPWQVLASFRLPKYCFPYHSDARGCNTLGLIGTYNILNTRIHAENMSGLEGPLGKIIF